MIETAKLLSRDSGLCSPAIPEPFVHGGGCDARNAQQVHLALEVLKGLGTVQ